MNHYFGCQSWLQAAAFALRYQIFVEEQHIDPKAEFDETPENTYHYFVLFDNSHPVATLRYQALDHQTINPDRFCVAKAYRKKGWGSFLLHCYEDQAKAEGYLFSQVSAEKSAENFYLKAGYHTCDKLPYLEDGIQCIQMKKTL